MGAPRDPQANLCAWSLAMLAVVTLLLGGLQYRWIGEVSQAQTARTEARLRQEAGRIRDALDTEITRAALVFGQPAGGRAGDVLEQSWAAWNGEAPWPRIVSGVALAEPDRTGWQIRTWGNTGRLDFRALLPAEGGREERRVAGEIADLFLRGQPYFLRPVPAMEEPGEPPKVDWVLIRYDLNYLKNSVFPELAKKFVREEDRFEYRFELGPKRSVAHAAIEAASQLHFRPDCLMPGGEGRSGFSVSVVRGRGRAASHFAVATFAPVSALLQASGGCEMPVSASDPGLMQLSVQRNEHTLVDEYTGFRHRSEIVSGAMLLVLAAALVALVLSAERARRLARWQTLIAAGISHELRTPLASLSVAADHLKNGHVENGEQARRYGEIIESQSRRLRHVVDQALTLTKAGQTKGVSRGETVAVPELVAACLAGLGPRLQEAGIQTHCRVQEDTPMAAADADLLLRCLTNLVENAIQYAAAGGFILISAEGARYAGRRVVEIAVEDRGPGIPEEEAGAVFEPFYRGSAARASRQPGSGLGLAIVKSALEASGGWVELEPAMPHGCRVRMRLPAAGWDEKG